MQECLPPPHYQFGDILIVQDAYSPFAAGERVAVREHKTATRGVQYYRVVDLADEGRTGWLPVSHLVPPMLARTNNG